MRYLQVLNLGVAVLAATLGLVLAVVALMYGVHRELSTAVARELPAIVQLVGVCALCMAAAGAAWWTRHRRHPLATVAQFAAVAVIASAALVALRVMGIR